MSVTKFSRLIKISVCPDVTSRSNVEIYRRQQERTAAVLHEMFVSTRLHDVTFQKTVVFTLTTVKSSNPVQAVNSEAFSLLVCYATQVGSWYQPTSRSIPEMRRPQLHRGGSLKSRLISGMKIIAVYRENRTTHVITCVGYSNRYGTYEYRQWQTYLPLCYSMFLLLLVSDVPRNMTFSGVARFCEATMAAPGIKYILQKNHN